TARLGRARVRRRPRARDSQGKAMAGRQIEVAADGGAFEAYLSTPDTGKVPGVVLVSSIFGLTRGMKERCDDLADRGSVALVQNLFWRDDDSGALEMQDFQDRKSTRL